MPAEQTFFLVAGEASGDLLGVRLMHALRAQSTAAVKFVGVGGPRMRKAGLNSLFDQEELAHMGLIEIIRHIPQLLARIRQVADAVIAARPTALITIDSPDFCFRVAKRVHGHGIPIIHYVAPSVWAWRPGRAKKVARFLDHLLALLPFEPPYFTREGLGCSFVGHSIVESGADKGDAARFRAAHGIAADAPILTVLPGSRGGEIARLMPIYGAVMGLIKSSLPALDIVIPTLPHMRERVAAYTAGWPFPVTIVLGDAEKYDAFAASRAALACSGTVAVELALARLPALVTYRINALTAAIYRRLIRVKYASLANIMKNEMVVPELLQDDCTPYKIAPALLGLLQNKDARQRQIAALSDVASWLGSGQFVPSQRAAEVILSVVQDPAKAKA